MGKWRDSNAVGNDDLSSSQPHKKHKKHKHKKHKKHRESASGGQSSDTGQSELVEATDSLTGKPQLKLKIKIGGQTLRTKSFDKISVTASSDEPSEDEDRLHGDSSNDTWRGATPSPVSQGSSKSISKLSKEEAEEEAWLDALEAGKLDEYGEIPKPKDESLLTARQKSLLKRMAAEEDDLIPSPFFGAQGKIPEMTEEMIEKKAQKAQRRRVQERRKQEESKKQTIEKLLKKQDAKLKAAKAKLKRNLEVPHIRYCDNSTGISLSYPAGYEFPLPTTQPLTIKPITKCGVSGCLNGKKYSCSKTGVPLCSLECYRKNQTLLCAT
ncbi:INO80 complex subunit B-like [Lytechinus pictus]|uniref:INO80 complex subunit B-like n=1 Tax=Lytechinus pictus TaxID=7653 RepID=UPI00240DA2D9|nr:INO80 complex subunit B-like [Lytechinus pictus]